MKITTSVPLGQNKVVIEGDGIKQLFMVAGFFAKIPCKCGNCQGGNLVLSGYKNSGYDFYSVTCRDCRHELKFGQKKESNELFLRDDAEWEAPYEASAQPRQRQPDPRSGSDYGGQEPRGGGGTPPPDDIPF